MVLSWTPFVFAAVLIASLSALLLAIGMRNPRVMLQDYPEDVRRAVPPKTPDERREMVWWAAGLLVLMLGLPLAAVVVTRLQQPELSFSGAFLTAFVVVMAFNLYDLLVIDWWFFCTWTPRLVVLPGTDGMAGYKDYGLHLRGFLIGVGWSVAVSAVDAMIASVLPM
jgi:hypothetical protein